MISDDDWSTCLRVLREIADDPETNPDPQVMKGLVTQIYREARRERRRKARQTVAAADSKVLESTGRRQIDSVGKPALALGEIGQRRLQRATNCYVCKQPYNDVDPFYHMLCPSCAAVNHGWRDRSVDLTGRQALITGSRIKIGFQTTLKLLRAGASVVATTRFPIDAVGRYQQEPDFEQWRDRLKLVRLDLRDLISVERFTQHLTETLPQLDIIINNAAQTIRRPPEYYARLAEAEAGTVLELTDRELIGEFEVSETTPTSIATSDPRFPAGVAFDGEPLDLRESNSWSLGAADVGIPELLEAHLVNSFSPFVLNSRLKNLMKSSPFGERFIVNVSAMEGQFGRETKTAKHPHTNMAKAGLNMMTRTCARDFATDGIYMNSVDTGWITNEHPHETKTAQRENGFVPPLDVLDGASRVFAPIVLGVEGKPEAGKFYKDYREYAW